MAPTTRGAALLALCAGTAVNAASLSAAADPCQTDQVRISLTNAMDGSEMTVSWATGNTSTPAGYAGYVHYGTSPSALTFTSAQGDSRNYTMWGLQSPYFHAVTLTKLVPRTRYYYAISAKGCAPTATFSFVSPPVVGDRTPFTLAGYGDMGVEHSNWTAAALTAAAAAGDIDGVLHWGDISYADDRITESNGTWYDTVQNAYWNEVSPYLSAVPGMLSSGNHEIAGDHPANHFRAYLTRVAPTMPTASSGAPFWWSFNYGFLHVVAMDTDQPWAAGSEQFNWILNDLANVNRSLTPLVLLMNHFPLLCTNEFWCQDGSGQAQRFRATYEPIFNAPATRVHLFMSGHVHAAEVMWPLPTGGFQPSQHSFTGLSTLFQAVVGFPGDMEVCCNSWSNDPSITPISAYRSSDYLPTGAFGYSTLRFLDDSSVHFQLHDAVNASVIFDQLLTFA